MTPLQAAQKGRRVVGHACQHAGQAGRAGGPGRRAPGAPYAQGPPLTQRWRVGHDAHDAGALPQRPLQGG